MLWKKLFLFAFITVCALLVANSEARHHKKRSKKWRKLVHRKCKNDGDAVVAIGGEIDKKMIRFGTRAARRGYKNITLAINGRDLVQPHNRKHRSRNKEFLRKLGGTLDIIVLPWSTKHKVHDLKPRQALKLYKKSAKAISKVIKTMPRAIHVPKESLKKKYVKYFTKKGLIVVGNTMYKPDSKTLDKSSFIGLQHASAKGYFRYINRAKKAEFNIVPLTDCLGKATFKGGLENL